MNWFYWYHLHTGIKISCDYNCNVIQIRSSVCLPIPDFLNELSQFLEMFPNLLNELS